MDDDKIVFYRRIENVYSPDITHERITINRATKTLTSELVEPLPNFHEKIYEKTIIEAKDDDKAEQSHLVYDD